MKKEIQLFINDLVWEQNDETQISKPLYYKKKYVGFSNMLNEIKYVVLLIDNNYKLLKKLARILNTQNVRVILHTNYKSITKKEELRRLRKISSFSQDDIKTAVMVGSLSNNKVISLMYTYNQLFQKTKKPLHAEQVLIDYINNTKNCNFELGYWLMLLEPCYRCLKGMAEFKSTYLVEWVRPHKAKWNTKDYSRLKDLLGSKYRRVRLRGKI